MAAAQLVFFQLLYERAFSTQTGQECLIESKAFTEDWWSTAQVLGTDIPRMRPGRKARTICEPDDVFMYDMTCEAGRTFNVPDDVKLVTFTPGLPCGRVLNTKGVLSPYSSGQQDWIDPDSKMVELLSKDLKLYPPVTAMRSKESKPTDGCFNAPTNCILQIYSKSTVFGRGVCSMVEQINCKNKCNNGEKLTGQCKQESGLSNKTAECVRCAPGTWNTCQSKDTCEWMVPTRLNPKALGSDIHPFFPPPVGRCYPCAFAKQSYVHYAYSSTPGKASELVDDLDVYCPGGDLAPRNCKSSNFQHSKDYSRCVCKDGFYDEAGACVACPKGYWCLEGVKTPCPLHKYQDLEKATECKSCAVERDGELVYSGCTGNQQRRWCEPGTSEPACVPCTRCRKAYLTRNTDKANPEVDCYKNY